MYTDELECSMCEAPINANRPIYRNARGFPLCNNCVDDEELDEEVRELDFNLGSSNEPEYEGDEDDY